MLIDDIFQMFISCSLQTYLKYPSLVPDLIEKLSKYNF